MVRSASKKNMLIAAVITFSIFIIGLLVGVSMSAERAEYSNEQMIEHKMELDSLQLQYAFINEVEMENHCAALSTAIEENVKKLGILGSKIQKYSSDMNFDEEEYNRLKREYVLSEMRFWLFSKKAQELCKEDTARIIYFYSNEEECFNCDAQAKVLTYLKEQLQDKLLIFSIDTAFRQEPLVEMLQETHNITEYPSILINNKLYSGLLDEDELSQRLCDIYKEKPAIC